MAFKTIILTGAGTWTVPSDWNNAWNTIYAIGAGGSGTKYGGGGGGACAFTENFFANPGDTLTYSAPLTSLVAHSDGADAWLSRTGSAPVSAKQGILAKGGKKAILNGGRAGGLASESIGETKFSGGNGIATGSTAKAGGGAGGSAGPNGAGANGIAAQGNLYGGAGGACNGGAVPTGATEIVEGATLYIGGLNRYGQRFNGSGGNSGQYGVLDFLFTSTETGVRAGPIGGDGGLNPGGGLSSGGGDWGTNPQCFMSGVMIDTPQGKIKIEDLKEDDLVYAFDIGTNKNYSTELHPKKITKTIKTTLDKVRLYTITHEFGTFQATNNHKVLTSSKEEPYVEVESLNIGDILYTADGNKSKIIGIFAETLFKTTVYDIVVDDYHTFVADNIRVHNPDLFTARSKKYIEAGGGGGGIYRLVDVQDGNIIRTQEVSDLQFSPGGDAIIVIVYMPTTSVKTVIFTGTGGTWTVPSDWNNLYNRIYGIGAGGGATSTINSGGGGGYAQLNNYLLNPGDVTYWSAPLPDTFTGNDAWFNRVTNALPTDISQGLVARGSRGEAGGGNSQSIVNIGDKTYVGGNGSSSLYAGGGGAAGPSGPGGIGGGNPSGQSPNLGGGGGGGANNGENGGNSATAAGANGGNNVAGTGGGIGATSGTVAGTPGSNGGGGGGGYYNGTFGSGNFEAGGFGGTQSIWTQSQSVAGSTTAAGSSVGPTGGTGAWAGYPAGAEGPGFLDQNNRATGFGSGGGAGVAKGGGAVIVVQYVPITSFKTIFITSTQNFIVPPDFDRNRNVIFAIGPGGNAIINGGGGAGGSFAQMNNIDLVPNLSYRANVDPNGDTWFRINPANLNAPTGTNEGLLAKRGGNALSGTGGSVAALSANFGHLINTGGAGGNGGDNVYYGGGGGAGGPNRSGGRGGNGLSFAGGGGGGADGLDGQNAFTSPVRTAGRGGHNRFGYGGGNAATASSPALNAQDGNYGGGGGGGAGGASGTNTFDNGGNGSIQRLFVEVLNGVITETVGGPSGGGGGAGKDGGIISVGGSASFGGGAGAGRTLGTPGSGLIVILYQPRGVQGNMILMF